MPLDLSKGTFHFIASFRPAREFRKPGILIPCEVTNKLIFLYDNVQHIQHNLIENLSQAFPDSYYIY